LYKNNKYGPTILLELIFFGLPIFSYFRSSPSKSKNTPLYPTRSGFLDFGPDPDFFPIKVWKKSIFYPKSGFLLNGYTLYLIGILRTKGSTIEIFSRCFRSLRMNKKVKYV